MLQKIRHYHPCCFLTLQVLSIFERFSRLFGPLHVNETYASDNCPARGSERYNVTTNRTEGTCIYTEPTRLLLDFSLTVKAAPHECVIRTSQP